MWSLLRKSSRLLMPFSVLALMIVSSCTEINNEEEIEVRELIETISYKSIDGVSQNLLDLDIYFDSEINNKKPVVIWVHGGGWSIGDKRNKIEDKVTLFRKAGYLLVSINYRLSPVEISILDPSRIKFPDHNLDVADAVKWVVDYIEGYGGDPNKIVLLGHSAGAHLVALTGISDQFLPAKGIARNHLKGIACIDTEGYDVVGKIEEGNGIYINAFGQDPQENVNASPIALLKAGVEYPHFFIAKRGNEKRQNLANEFSKALRNTGADVTVLEADEYSHSGINNAIGMDGEVIVTDPLMVFLQNCFY